ncbi:MAG TPA: hypothetical protein DGG95_02025 [Cytophagales bacterium]|jgi:hypothetical protein|nr:hypothetical protein [Cytophagales bacterium]
MKKIIFILIFIFSARWGSAQHFNVGFTFQYHILKQVAVNSDQIVASRSYSLYNVIDNRWKFFAAGQSLVVGTIVQADFKKFYVGIEPSFELNTYEYYVGYTLSATQEERLRFHTLFLQMEMPVYVGYMFKSSDLFRYSFYAGVSPVSPYHVEASVVGSNSTASDRYDWQDMNNVLYNGKPYLNSVTGFALHFASLGRLDLRYVHRLGSPGVYQTTFNTVGMGLTFFLPLHLYKKKIYYEE